MFTNSQTVAARLVEIALEKFTEAEPGFSVTEEMRLGLIQDAAKVINLSEGSLPAITVVDIRTKEILTYFPPVVLPKR